MGEHSANLLRFRAADAYKGGALSQPSAAGSGHRKLAFLLLSLGVLGAADEIGKTELLLTMVGGKIVYQSPRWVGAASTSAAATEGKH